MTLPYLYQRLAAAVGQDLAEDLAAELGGCDIKIPVGPLTEHHPLRRLCDPESAAAIAQALGPGLHYLPAQTRTRAAARAERVREAAARHEPLVEIARREGISTRWVRALLQQSAS